jgi:hypothetical protein
LDLVEFHRLARPLGRDVVELFATSFAALDHLSIN